ncbi:MAG: response regulator transcription factor [Tetrasphaera sp.]|nr:response regulator transcription factor [Tetrasphaera sp.]
MIRVVIVDDQELLREGFRLILERAGMEVVGEAGDGLEAIEVCRATTPEVVLMDVRMPRLDGIEATRRIVAAQPGVRVMALTTFDLDEYVYGAVRAGASGFLLKDVSPRDLVHAVEVVARGEATVKTYVSRMLTKLDLRDRVQLAVLAYESGLVMAGRPDA